MSLGEGRICGLDLFSGIGGISLALEPWVRTVAYCESDRFAQSVLFSRMRDGLLRSAPVWDDVRSLSGAMLPPIDIIFGGWPCQDTSSANRAARGLDGERSNLFFEILRLADEIEPGHLFLENVPALRTRGLDRVVEGLASLRYDCRWTTLSAEEVGARHKRNRFFILASRANVADSARARLEVREGLGKNQIEKLASAVRESWWHSEPCVDRVADGIPYRMDRVRSLGNAVVPLQAREAFRLLAGLK